MANTAKEVAELLAGCVLPHWERFAASITTRHLRAGEFLFHAGQMQSSVFIVNRGVVKLVYETVDGKYWVKNLATAGTYIANVTTRSQADPARFSAQALADTQLEEMAYEQIQSLARRHIEWQRVVGRAYELYASRTERREMEFLTKTAEERYLRFLVEYEEFAAMIPQKDVASYIGVTPVALSRIKSRLRHRALDEQ
jgi:CRP-like cAMP-binding protein